MPSRLIYAPVLLLCLATLPAVEQDDIYDNGPRNGTVDAWTINFGFIVSDTFTIGANNTSVDGLTFSAWLFPGDVLESAEVSITSSEFGGTTFFDGNVNFTQGNCTTNQLGYSLCDETGSFGPVSLNAGTYWLNLQNAVVNTGDPVYWDENSGPSRASENSVGTIPSESFTLLGGGTCGGNCGEPAPEPSSLMLCGSGVLVIAGRLCRKR